MLLRTDQIIVKTNHVRAKNSADLEALKDSLRQHGQRVPIGVFQDDNLAFVLLYGFSRLQAAKELGWQWIDVVICSAPGDEADLILTQYVENNFRWGLTYFDRCQAYQAMKDTGMTQASIAKLVGKSEAEISLSLKFLSASGAVVAAVVDGSISPSAAEPLLSLSKEDQERLIDAAVRAKTVKKINDLVRADKRKNDLKAEAVERAGEDEDPLEIMVIMATEQALKAVHDVANTLAALGGKTQAVTYAIWKLQEAAKDL